MVFFYIMETEYIFKENRKCQKVFKRKIDILILISFIYCYLSAILSHEKCNVAKLKSVYFNFEIHSMFVRIITQRKKGKE